MVSKKQGFQHRRWVKGVVRMVLGREPRRLGGLPFPVGAGGQRNQEVVTEKECTHR